MDSFGNPVTPTPAAERTTSAMKPVVDVDGKSFEQEVVRSPVPVMVYIDGPGQSIAQPLTDIVNRAQGRLRLAKVNIQRDQQLASALQVQSVPAVMGIAQGQMVDMIEGNVSSQRLQQFIEKLLQAGAASGGRQGSEGDPITRAVDAAEAALQEGMKEATGKSSGATPGWLTGASEESSTRVREAHQIFEEVVRRLSEVGEELAAEHRRLGGRAVAGSLLCLMAQGEVDQAVDFAEQHRRVFLDPCGDEDIVKETLEQLDRAVSSKNADATLDPLREAVREDPGDLEAVYKLAEGLKEASRFDEAIDTALKIVRRNRSWNDDAGRKLLLSIFEQLGPSHPATKKGRKELSKALFV